MVTTSIPQPTSISSNRDGNTEAQTTASRSNITQPTRSSNRDVNMEAQVSMPQPAQTVKICENQS